MKRKHTESAYHIPNRTDSRGAEIVTRYHKTTWPWDNYKHAISSLGNIVLTSGAEKAFAESGAAILPFLIRHCAGDWGDEPEADKQEKAQSVREGRRFLSIYHMIQTGVRFWVITEVNRSMTTLLLPEEY